MQRHLLVKKSHRHAALRRNSGCSRSPIFLKIDTIFRRNSPDNVLSYILLLSISKLLNEFKIQLTNLSIDICGIVKIIELSLHKYVKKCGYCGEKLNNSRQTFRSTTICLVDVFVVSLQKFYYKISKY